MLFYTAAMKQLWQKENKTIYEEFREGSKKKVKTNADNYINTNR